MNGAQKIVEDTKLLMRLTKDELVRKVRHQQEWMDRAREELRELKGKAESVKAADQRLNEVVQRNLLLDSVEDLEVAESDYFHHRRRREGARGRMLSVHDQLSHERQLDRQNVFGLTYRAEDDS